MGVMRTAGLGIAAAGILAAGLSARPATAQFFMQPKNLSGDPVRGDEPGIGQPLPGATERELTAGLVWQMRAALNVAALQCQFEPTLLTVPNYNAILTDHKVELKDSFDTLTKYFVRTNKTPKAGQMALDQFGTKTYAGFATVAAQYNFCETANSIGRDAIFQPRGSFAGIARLRMRELRNSLVPWGEQRFPRQAYQWAATLPRLDAICWSKRGEWQTKKCGALNFPPAGTSVAQR